MLAESIVHRSGKCLEIDLAFGDHVSHFGFALTEILTKRCRGIHTSRRKLKQLFAHQSAITGDRGKDLADRLVVTICHSGDTGHCPQRCKHLITSAHTRSCKLRSNFCCCVQTVGRTVNRVINVFHDRRNLGFIFEQTLKLEVSIFQVHGSSDTTLDNTVGYETKSFISKSHGRIGEVLNHSHTNDSER